MNIRTTCILPLIEIHDNMNTSNTAGGGIVEYGFSRENVPAILQYLNVTEEK